MSDKDNEVKVTVLCGIGRTYAVIDCNSRYRLEAETYGTFHPDDHMGLPWSEEPGIYTWVGKLSNVGDHFHPEIDFVGEWVREPRFITLREVNDLAGRAWALLKQDCES